MYHDHQPTPHLQALRVPELEHKLGPGLVPTLATDPARIDAPIPPNDCVANAGNAGKLIVCAVHPKPITALRPGACECRFMRKSHRLFLFFFLLLDVAR